MIRLHPDANVPDMEAHDLYMRYHAAYSDLYAATVAVMHRLADLSIESG